MAGAISPVVSPAAAADDVDAKRQVETVEDASPQSRKDRHQEDAAAELLRRTGAATTANGRVAYTLQEDVAILRKIDLVMLPLMLTVYFLQQLDKSTLSYASVFGLITETHLQGDQYSWLGSVVYIAQLVMQPLVAYALVVLPVGKFASVSVMLWGVVLACMTAATSFSGLMVARLFLGLLEAGVAPTFVAVTQMWWRRREQTVRVSSWYLMNGFVNMFGSLISWGLGHIHSSQLYAYQIIFLFFGVITVAFSVVMFFFFPDSPITARFLTDHEKLIAIERVRGNRMGVMSREWRWDHVREAALDAKTWLWFALLMSISIPSGGITTFGPLIVSSFGFDSFSSILLNIPFGAVQSIATMGGAWVAMKTKKKGPVIAALCLPPIAGCAILMAFPHDASHKGALLAGYYLISVYPGITPLIYSWSAQNTAGDTKRKCVTAALFVGQSVGNVVGPQLYTTAEAPGYARGLRSNLALYVVIVVLVAVITAYLGFLNRSHAKRRVAMGKSAVVVDTSLDSAQEVELRRRQEEEERAAAGVGVPAKEGGDAGGGAVVEEEEEVEDKSMRNMTDLMNEDFVFVY